MNYFGYSIAATLSESGKSVIYRTAPGPGGISHIIKALKQPGISQEQNLDLKREFTLLEKLDSPYIIQAKQLLTQNGSSAILFEYFPGVPLDQLLTTGTLPQETCLEIGCQVARALEEVHAKNIIHKDISPANILYDSATSQVKLIDFGIASLLDQEQPIARSTSRLEGTVAYISPEQTGRMNRLVDYRTDFYSLGMLLYHLFCGRLPFTTSDPLEIIHFHLARRVEPPSAFRPKIDRQIEAIILKLLDKSADHRYQTARGVRKDLERCLAELESNGSITSFPLAADDISAKLTISQKLYGRETEIDTLIGCFERVAAGATELVFVAGYSGIGKTALVNEVHKPITRKRGVFVAGKFDQYQRNVPYSAFTNVFNQLIGNVLHFPEERLARYRTELIEQFGIHIGVFTRLVPDLELLVGPQGDPPHLGPAETQNVFNQLTKKFIHIFARQEHPLAIFIDDFQWADLASLNMLNVLLTDPEMHHLLVIGAYRDNEVDETHPLLLTKKQVEARDVALSTLTLTPLSLDNVAEMVQDTFHVDHDNAMVLAETLMEKALGNPFFINQMIKQLHDEGLIRFDTTTFGWHWQHDEIANCGVSANVVDLMLSRLARLPEDARDLLMLASCIGQHIQLEWLAVITDSSLPEVAGRIWPVIEMGLILPADGSGRIIQLVGRADVDQALDFSQGMLQIRFLHDRVQQAAYSMIEDRERDAIHLRIGRRLLAHCQERERDKHIFTIVAQFNMARAAITDPHELLAMAELNLRAATRAKETLAYHSAIELFTAGFAMLGDEPFQTDYPLAFSLFYERAECRYFIADLGRAEDEFLLLLDIAREKAHKALVYKTFVDLYTTKGEIQNAVQAAIDGCALFDIPLYLHPTREQVLAVYQDILDLLGERQISELEHLPAMSDPEMEVALAILAAMMPPALFFDENLLYLEHCHMVRISLMYGNAPPSASGYSYFGMILGCMLGEFKQGYEFGKLGYNLLSRPGFEYYRAKVCLSFGSNVNFWVNHVVSDLRYLEEGFKAAIESGDITYSCYHCNHIVMVNLASGLALDLVHEDAEKRKKYVATTGYTEIVDIIESKQRLVQCLRGETSPPGSFSDPEFDEAAFEDHLKSNMSITVCWYYIHKTQARYTFGRYQEAIAAAERAEELIWSSVAHVELPEHYLYYSLALAAVHPQAGELRKREIEKLLDTHLQMFARWQESCPDNFAHKYQLIAAEIARLAGKDVLALQGYEQAMKTAGDNGFIQLRALAAELALRLTSRLGLSSSSGTYLTLALDGYGRWKAAGKVNQLRQEFATLLVASARQAHTTTQTHAPTSFAGRGEQAADMVDYTTIVNMSRAFATHIDMGSLLVEIMKYALENSGAEKAGIVVREDDNFILEVYADEETIRSGLITSNIRDNIGDFISMSIVRYVARTGRTLILEHAANKGDFIDDPYIAGNRCKSLLCMPFSYKKNRRRFLYLENNQIIDAFPGDRVETLSLILPQAAVSIENAKLFEDLQQAHEDLKEKQAILVESEQRFRQMAENISSALWIASPDRSKFLYISRVFEQIWRASREELYQDSTLWMRYIHPDDRQRFANHASQQRGEHSEITYRILAGDGSQRWVSDKTFPLLDNDGRFTRLVGITDDITEQIEAEEQRRRQEGQLRSIFANSVDAIGVTRDGLHLLVNPAYARMFGYNQPTHLIGTPILDLIVPDEQEQFAEHLRQHQHDPGEAGSSCETRGRRRDGQDIDLEVNISRYGLEGDLNTLFIIRDTTEKKLLENQIRQSQKMEAIGTLAGGIAHDFNNILSAIIGYSELAQLDSTIGKNPLRHLDQVLVASRRAKELVAQILAFSRQADTGRIPVQAGEMLLDIVKMLRPTIPTTITIDSAIADNSGTLLANPTQIHQVLMNLATNAYHAMEVDGGTLRLAVDRVFLAKRELPPESTCEPGSYIRFTVCDTGPGIPEEITGKIFDPYFTTKTTGKGTGMGLAIVHGTVYSYGGFIRLENRPGQGACFHVFLPAIEVQPATEPDDHEQMQLPGGSERIMLVDDEPLLAEVSRTMLARLGYQVEVHLLPENALTTITGNPQGTDLLITDQTMPGLTGAELAKQVLAIRPDLPIILCTGYSSLISADTAREIGIREYAMKPIGQAEMAQLVRRVLDNL